MAYTPTDNPYIPGDPYSYDLKWIVTKIKEALTSIEGLTTGQSDLAGDFKELKEYVYNYFDNLDISQEVEDKINELYAAGFFDTIINNWMNDHVNLNAPNLLTNSWFNVNQRGITSGGNIDAAEYVGPDRWKMFRAASWSVQNNAVTIAWNGTGAAAGLTQYTGPEIGNPIKGKTATLSAYVNGVLYFKTFTIPNAGGSISATPFGGEVLYLVNSDDEAAQNRGIEIQFRTLSTNGATIGPVKLELGSFSTLANEAPPNFDTELLKCQYYYQPITIDQDRHAIGQYHGIITTQASGVIDLNSPMQDGTANVTITGGLQATNAEKVNHSSITINQNRASIHGSKAWITLIGTDFTADEIGFIYGSSSGVIGFSREL